MPGREDALVEGKAHGVRLSDGRVEDRLEVAVSTCERVSGGTGTLCPNGNARKTGSPAKRAPRKHSLGRTRVQSKWGKVRPMGSLMRPVRPFFVHSSTGLNQRTSSERDGEGEVGRGRGKEEVCESVGEAGVLNAIAYVAPEPVELCFNWEWREPVAPSFLDFAKWSPFDWRATRHSPHTHVINNTRRSKETRKARRGRRGVKAGHGTALGRKAVTGGGARGTGG